MGLIICPDCQQQVSDKAPTCPHCGRPMASGLFSPAAQSGIESFGKALSDGVQSFSSALLTAFLVPVGCLVWVLLGGFAGCMSMFGGGGDGNTTPNATTARHASPQSARAGFWLSTDGGSRNIGAPLKTCRIDTVTVLRDRESYDTSGTASYRYVVHIDVYNHTGVPTGPRVTVRLYGRTAKEMVESNIAYSLSSDLAPGSRKRFTDAMYAPFVATWVDFVDANH